MLDRVVEDRQDLRSPRPIAVVDGHDRGIVGQAEGRLAGMRELLTAGADDRLDELPIRVVVSVLHQFKHRLAAIGGRIVRAGEVERTDRIV